MYPIGSNGATQGVIDARAFAFHLTTAPSVDEALNRYAVERRPATARIVEMNPTHGPDRIMELAEQGAPNPGDDLDASLPMDERRSNADQCKKIGGVRSRDPQCPRRLCRREMTPGRSGAAVPCAPPAPAGGLFLV